jgi:hypothetical protein
MKSVERRQAADSFGSSGLNRLSCAALAASWTSPTGRRSVSTRRSVPQSPGTLSFLFLTTVYHFFNVFKLARLPCKNSHFLNISEFVYLVFFQSFTHSKLVVRHHWCQLLLGYLGYLVLNPPWARWTRSENVRGVVLAPPLLYYSISTGSVYSGHS